MSVSPGYNPIWPTHKGKHLHGYVKKIAILVRGYTYSTTAHPDDEKLFNYLLNRAGFRRNSQGRRIEAILLTVMRRGKESRSLLENQIPIALHTKNMNLKAMQEDKLRVSRLRGAKATGLQRRYGKVADGRKIVENRRDGTGYNGHDVWNEALDQECYRDWIESERRLANGVPEHRNHPPEPRKWRAMNAKNLELIQRELANDP
jgi:hypothetical protein